LLKIVVLIKRKPGTTKEEFSRYYEEKHVPLALTFIRPYLLDYRRSYPQQEAGYADTVADKTTDPGRPTFEYDAITEMWFKDQAHLDQMFELLSQPHVRGALTADENRFLDRDNVRVIQCKEHRAALD
jgi:uncharacterized protein (TIGR02118 family)